MYARKYISVAANIMRDEAPPLCKAVNRIAGTVPETEKLEQGERKLVGVPRVV
jgi:hypothetical protein